MRDLLFRWLMILAGLLYIGVPAPSHAQDASQQFRKHLDNADAYIQLEQFRNAALEYLAAYELDPKPKLLFNAGRAYSKGGHHTAALAEYARFLEHTPSGVLAEIAREAFYEVAEIEWQQKAFGAALDHYQQYIEYDSRGPNVARARDRLLEYAEFTWQSGHKDASLAHYERFVRLSPEHPNVPMARKRVFDLAEELWHGGDQERALDYYQRFATSEPKMAETAMARARIFERGEEYWRRGDRRRAIVYYERYLTIEADDEIAQRARLRIAEHTAALEKARLAAESKLVEAARESTPIRQSDAAREDTTTTAARTGPVPRRESRLRISALVHAAIDQKARGAAAQAGVDVHLGLGMDVRVAGVLGPTMGAYIGGNRRFAVLRGLDLSVGVGLPVFFSNGARVGVRGSGGLEWRAMRHLALMLELGVEHVFNPEWNRESTALVPLVGVRAR